MNFIKNQGFRHGSDDILDDKKKIAQICQTK